MLEQYQQVAQATLNCVLLSWQCEHVGPFSNFWTNLTWLRNVHQGMQQSILLVQWHLIHSSESETQH